MSLISKCFGRLEISCVLGVLLLLGPPSASAVSVSISTATPSVAVGEVFSVDLAVADLGAAAAPSISAFGASFDFSGDGSVVWDDIVFGPDGDEFGFAPITAVDPSDPDSVSFSSLSFDDPLTLNSQQSSAFRLATVVFVANTVGTIEFDLSASLFDAFGIPLLIDDSDSIFFTSIQVVPLPAPLLLLLSALMGMFAVGQRCQRPLK